MKKCLTRIFTASFTVSLGLNLVNNDLQVRIGEVPHKGHGQII